MEGWVLWVVEEEEEECAPLEEEGEEELVPLVAVVALVFSVLVPDKIVERQAREFWLRVRLACSQARTSSSRSQVSPEARRRLDKHQTLSLEINCHV